MSAEPPELAPSKRVPLGKRLGPLALIFAGATATLSALVNATAAWWLIQGSDEEFLGISRRDVLLWCALLFAAGTLFLFLGIRSWRSARGAGKK